MKKWIILLFINGCMILTYAQSLDLVWPLGYGLNPKVNLNFTSGNLVLDTCSHIMDFRCTNSSIADSTGHLLMYSNGCIIANGLNNIMLNGDSLNLDTCTLNVCGSGSGGGIISQGNLILPDPGVSNHYYLFHQTCNYGNSLSPIVLYYSNIDMSLDSGRGGVINKNTALYQHPQCDASLTAVKHANGIDWWVMIHNRLTDEFVKFLITSIGIQGPFIQSIGPVFDHDSRGNSKFSPDGNHFVSTTHEGSIHLFDFDRCTGNLSNYLYIPIPDILYNPFIGLVEFSSSSRFLYYIDYMRIYQYDMLSSNIANSSLLIASYDGFANPDSTHFGIPQLAQDKKIYILGGNLHMHVINYPDSFGISADVSQHSITLPCYNYLSIPSFPNYHLGALPPHACDSSNYIETIKKEFEIEFSPNPVTTLLKVKTNSTTIDKYSISIYNSFGQKRSFRNLKFNNSSEEINLDISEFSAGVYYLIIENDKSVLKKSFIKY